VKIIALLLFTFGMGFAQQTPPREGNFSIRFEPAVKLQTGVEVPFQITVKNAIRQPLTSAKVTLQIATPDGADVKVFPAPAMDPGVYMAKPIFPKSGEWNVLVEVRRADQVSSRTIQFTVAE
jgi:hypothetical protein